MAMNNVTMGKVNASIDSVLSFFKTEYPKLGYALTYETGDAQNGLYPRIRKERAKNHRPVLEVIGWVGRYYIDARMSA
jgi:hypothetical protein